jgi:DNA-binding NtrC family response regulator
LITGDNGTGKSWCEHCHKSNRSSGPFIEGGILPFEIDREPASPRRLPGANKDRAGKFEAANGMVPSFSDEMEADMSLNAQATAASKKIRFNR